MIELFIAITLFCAIVFSIGTMLDYCLHRLERNIRSAIREEIERGR